MITVEPILALVGEKDEIVGFCANTGLTERKRNRKQKVNE